MSALALMGIAVSNVLMPVIVKRWFPDRVGSMTGLYSMALALGTSAAAAATVPMTDALGGDWRSGLVVWAGLAAAAVLPWVLLVRARGAGPGTGDREPAASGASRTGYRAPAAATAPSSATASRTGDRAPAAASRAGVPAPAAAAVTRHAPEGLRITRSRTAWALAVFFGLQATAAYITMGWMAQIFRDAGVASRHRGTAPRRHDGDGRAAGLRHPASRHPPAPAGAIVVVLGLCGLAGYAGLYLAPAAGAWAWALLLGVSNCAFPLALTMVGMRARTGAGVAELSAFAQSAGYLISIPGPLLVGVLYQHSGGWGLPLALMAGLMVPQIAVGIMAGRDRTVEDEAAG